MEIITLAQADKLSEILDANQIVFVLEGRCRIENDTHADTVLTANHALFLPVGNHVCFIPSETTTLVVIRFGLQIRLCEVYAVESLFSADAPVASTFRSEAIEVNTIIRAHVEFMVRIFHDGLTCQEFYDLKAQELLYLLRTYYSDEQLRTFFLPILSRDATFAQFILDKWHTVKSVKEFAALSNYCETGFSKKFKSTFGVTPYRWLNERRSMMIYRELTTTDKSIKEICEEYRFNTLQQFNTYCKQNFSLPPSQIRKNRFSNS